MNRKQVNNVIPHSGQSHDTGFSFIILCYYQCVWASAHRVLQQFKCWTYFYLKAETVFSERPKDFKGRLKSAYVRQSICQDNMLCNGRNPETGHLYLQHVPVSYTRTGLVFGALIRAFPFCDKDFWGESKQLLAGK